jgi:hypothetical protein
MNSDNYERLFVSFAVIRGFRFYFLMSKFDANQRKQTEFQLSQR